MGGDGVVGDSDVEGCVKCKKAQTLKEIGQRRGMDSWVTHHNRVGPGGKGSASNVVGRPDEARDAWPMNSRVAQQTFQSEVHGK